MYRGLISETNTEAKAVLIWLLREITNENV